MAYCCPKLEAFRIGNCIDNSNISDVSVMKLASNCPLLRILHIERSGITDEALLKIASCCTQLKSLNVSDCSLTTVSAVQQLLVCQLIGTSTFRFGHVNAHVLFDRKCVQASSTLYANISSIKLAINLSRCIISYFTPSVTLTYWPLDIGLQVSGSKLTDSELFRIIRCIPELWHVNLSNGENFQVDFITCIHKG